MRAYLADLFACMPAGRFNNWRITMGLLTLILLVAVVMYAIGGCIRGKDYRPAAEQGTPQMDKVEPGLEGEDASLLAHTTSDVHASNRGLRVKYIVFASLDRNLGR